ncbi:hypothetical protein FO436_03910 [Weissella cibaria]|uniref:phage tail protein n=1 Tax=Weissella cibaria TaxID=137591 RepID=UPI00118F5CEE|nr:phage tail protein [Weissella cibaria]TVV33790.1 hypothetical protein FO436_03910 [Weissella cibaria]
MTYKEAVNGEKSLTGTIYSNDDVLHQMERGWSVMFNGDWYYITYVAPTGGGNSITVEFDAVHEFFFKMSKSVAYGTLKDGSHSAKEYLDFVFSGSEYSYTLLSQVDAWEKQNFGDKNRLALFNDLISDMEMEFSIADSGRIMITSEIGQDLSTIVRKGFNLQELNLEYNVANFVTYAKGFGAFIDKNDESKGRYEAEYTSPLASVYGKLEADPITDERYTKTASLQAALKKAVDSSYSISVGISLEELQNAGYDYESPVPGDYILAVDEQLDFNQRIRIISVEEQYNIYGERISSSVEAGSLSATKHKLDGSESNSVVLALSHATEQADNAVKTANGKNTSYSGPNEPQNPREGDMWWYDNGSGTSFMKQYTNGEWVILVDSNTKQNIENAVDNAIDTSKSYADDLNDKQTTLTNSLASNVQKKADSLSASQQTIASQASSYTDSALAQANANAQQIGQTTAQNAQQALDNAKSDLSKSIASEATARSQAVSNTARNAQQALDTAKSDLSNAITSEASVRLQAVSNANSQAQSYANRAKSDAITAATTADGVIRKDFKDTTDGIVSTITQNKKTADEGISTAQTTAQQAVDGLKTKVSQTDYNAKTGQLQTDLTATTQTANQAKTDIVSIKQKDGEQDAKMNSIVSDANGTKQTVSDLKTEQGKQSGSISELQQRADGFDATVTKVNNLSIGGRNLLIHTNENGWAGLNVGNGTATQKFVPFINGYKSEFEYTKVSTNWSVWQQYGVVKEKIKPDTEYTVSFMINSPESFTPAVGLCNGASRNYLNELTKSNKATIAKKDTRIEINFRTFKEDRFPEASDQTVYINGFVGIKGVFQIWDLKLEEGNVATDWSPAPEDLSSATAKAQLTADNATLAINNYKTDADGRISKAQADIVVNANAISQKVSQTDYDKKTGDLTTSVNKAQQTADSATQTIGKYQTSNDNRVKAAETNIQANAEAIKLTASKTDLDNATGKLSGSISTLEQRADGFDATVTKVSELDSATAKAQLTADNATLAINNYKVDADGRISKAQTDIKANADAITQKVSKTDYDQKTGDLTTKVSTAQQTADTATQTIGNYQTSNDKRVKSAETNIQANADEIKATVSKTDFDKATGKITGNVSELQQRADGFDATVTKVNNLAVGGRNLLTNTAKDISVTSHTTDMWPGWANIDTGFSFENGKTYTFSAEAKNSTDKIVEASIRVFEQSTNTQVGIYAFPADGKRHSITFAIPNDSHNYKLLFYAGHAGIAPGVDVTTTYHHPKLEAGNIATDWSPAPEDVDTQLAQVKITADGVYQTVNDPKTGLNTRVSTAEGNINKVQSTVNGMSNTVTQTSNGLTQEIADRKTGDSNTLQAGKDFTTSQITSYDTGMQSRLSQVSDGIMAQVSATNLIVDSSFVNALVNWTVSGDVAWKIDTGNMHEGVRVAKFDNGDTVFDRKTATLTSIPIYTMNLGGTQFYASFDLYAKSFGTSAYFKAEIVQKNSSGTTTKTTAIGGSFDTAMSDWTNYTANITLDPATTQLYLQFTQYGGGVIYVSRPYLGSVQLQKNAYIAGASTDNSSTLKLFNNFFAFGIQANTGALIAGINGDSSGLNIVGEKITITGDTTFIGKNFMDGALIKNASIGEAQIADVSITNAKIASLDVNKISGNVSSFIQSNWNGKYGSTTIDASGMTVDTGGITTKFDSYGMTLNMTGESVGGIGVGHFVGQPSGYQGLRFWLDGNAEYMAWGARDDGVTSGDSKVKLSWFRSSSAPSGYHAGFNFDDDVYFGRNINVGGNAHTQLTFATQFFNNTTYPYFGDSRLKAGFSFGSGATYLIADGKFYNLSSVIKGLSGLGAVKIPSVINSDGTVAKWFNVTL